MKHRVHGRILSRPSDERIALRRILLSQLFDLGKITTTEAKAKAIRGEAEKMITVAKRGLKAGAVEGDEAAVKAGKVKQANARQLLKGRLDGDKIVRKIFEEIAPRYAERKGGYTRLLKLGPRNGDAAPMVILELVEE
ncbi:MAG: 50S ribosomal protein L17 [Chloroflexi bacterium]|nr:50S ribosomal protein L17 [Chloroflexota bacterium]